MYDQSRLSTLYSPFPDYLEVFSYPSPEEDVKSNSKEDRDTNFWEIFKKVLALTALIIIKIYF